MKKVSPLVILIIGFGLSFIGNAISNSGTAIADIIGVGISLSGGIAILYSFYLMIKNLRNKPKMDKPKS